MIKVWFMLVLTSFPNAPSVKYNGFLYASEFECVKAQEDLMAVYQSKPLDYQLTVKLDAYCVEFESFPIEGLRSDIKA
jgi:hypothetical protein